MFASDGIDRGKKIGIIISNNLQVEKGCHAMTNATLRGKPDAGNPHVRFDEGEVASAKPRRGSLLYKKNLLAALCLCMAGVALAADDTFLLQTKNTTLALRRQNGAWNVAHYGAKVASASDAAAIAWDKWA